MEPLFMMVVWASKNRKPVKGIYSSPMKASRLVRPHLGVIGILMPGARPAIMLEEWSSLLSRQ